MFIKALATIAIICVCGSTLIAQLPQVTRYLDTFTKKNAFNGTIILAHDGSIKYHRSFGLANIPFKVPTTTDTKYKVASITKLFTAVLIMQLYEDGKIDLKKSIKTYLHGYKGPAGDSVTVEQLLTMTSGMHNMDEGLTLPKILSEGAPQYQRPYTSDQMLDIYSSDSLVKKPGTSFDYNNAEFIILGKIIEKISGKSYEHQLQEQILTPLKMKNSGMLKQANIVTKLADTYFYRDDVGSLVNDLPVYIENWYAAGAMYATATDIFSFCDALFNGRMLKSTSLNIMFKSGLGEYGYGVWVYKEYDINGKMYTIVKRPGSIMGAQAMIFHVIEANATIIVLSNSLGPSLDNFVADIAKKWLPLSKK